MWCFIWGLVAMKSNKGFILVEVFLSLILLAMMIHVMNVIIALW